MIPRGRGEDPTSLVHVSSVTMKFHSALLGLRRKKMKVDHLLRVQDTLLKNMALPDNHLTPSSFVTILSAGGEIQLARIMAPFRFMAKMGKQKPPYSIAFPFLGASVDQVGDLQTRFAIFVEKERLHGMCIDAWFV